MKLLKKISFLRIKEGVMIPKWQGLIYVNYMTFEAICTYMPLNFIFRFFLYWYYGIKVKWFRSDKISRLLQQEYQKGYDKGFADGRIAGSKIISNVVSSF